jgi:hypothetical protein
MDTRFFHDAMKEFGYARVGDLTREQLSQVLRRAQELKDTARARSVYEL